MSNPHKYKTPEWMVYRLAEWIGQNGGEDSTSLTMYEAQKTIERMQVRVKDLETALKPFSFGDRNLISDHDLARAAALLEKK